jgi:hypothetical protein
LLTKEESIAYLLVVRYHEFLDKAFRDAYVLDSVKDGDDGEGGRVSQVALVCGQYVTADVGQIELIAWRVTVSIKREAVGVASAHAFARYWIPVF